MWGRRRPPCRGVPLVSLALAGGPPVLHRYIDSKHRRLGPIFREPAIGVFLSHPAAIRMVFALEGKHPQHFLPPPWTLYTKHTGTQRGILFMDGEEWWKYRRLLNQHLLREDLSKGLGEVYRHVVAGLIHRWRAHLGTNIPNLEQDLYRHSISFMLATAMGSSYMTESHNFQEDLDRLSSIYQDIFLTTSTLMTVPIGLATTLRLPRWTKFTRTMDSSLVESDRVISKMMAKASADGLIKKLIDDGVDEKMIRALITDLMIAAGDTTALTTQWCLYLLGEAGELQQEACSIEGARTAVKETLRLYPAAPFLTRRLPAPADILNYNLPQGEMVIMSVYSCGRDEANFPRAEEFWPGRWRREGGVAIGVNNPAAFLPFAMGARSCVGRTLAHIHLDNTVSQILTHYKLKTMNKVDMVLRMIPVPAEKINLLINER